MVVACDPIEVAADHCKLLHLKQVNSTVYEAEIALDVDAAVSFKAGQYLDLVIGDDCYPFSIASAYESSISAPMKKAFEQVIQLHIGVGNQNSASQKIIAHLKKGSSFKISLPKGRCFLNESDQEPLLIIAASTGFAQAKSIIEACLHRSPLQTIHLYWGVRRIEDFYLLPLIEEWQIKMPNLRATLAVSANSPGEATSSNLPLTTLALREGNIDEVIAKEFKDLSRFKTFLCGSPTMVYSVLDSLASIGLKPENSSSDVFEYMPREQT